MSEEIRLRQVEAYENMPCPSCGGQIASHEVLEYLHSPALHEAPWASAILYGNDCRCGQRSSYDVEISVVPDVVPGASLLNDHQYKAAGYTRYLAGRGRREWNLVHLVNVSELAFGLNERLPTGESERPFDVPWLDEHNFNMMRWRDAWESALKLIETMLPVIRRITWPKE